MVYQKQTWNNYNDSLSIEQNKANNAFATSEGLNHIENGIEKVEFSLGQQLAETNDKINFQKKLVVNVKDFGAKGDDYTDDTLSIQKALDAVKKNGGIVEIPSGVYRVSMSDEQLVLDGAGALTKPIRSSLVLKGNNIHIKGGGIGATVIKMYPSDYREKGTITGKLSSIFTLECSFDSKPTHQKNITFEGLELNGGRGLWNQVVLDKDFVLGNGSFDNEGNNAKGIHARTIKGDLTNLKIHNCKIHSMYAEGVHSNKAKDSIVTDCIFDYNRPAGGNLSGSATYERCVFSRHYTFSIEHAHSAEKNHLKIIDCEFHDLDNLSQVHVLSTYNTPLEKNSLFEVTGCTFYYDNPSVTSRNVGSVKANGYDIVRIKDNRMLQRTNEGNGIFPIHVMNSQSIIIEDNYINQYNGAAYYFDNKLLKNTNYQINKNIRNVLSGSYRAMAIKKNSDAFGTMPSFNYTKNEVLSDNCVGTKIIKKDVEQDVTNNILYHYVGESKIQLLFDVDTVIKKFFYVAPTGTGGDGIKHDLIAEQLLVKANVIYEFEMKSNMDLLKTSQPAGGITFKVLTTNDVIANYRFSF